MELFCILIVIVIIQIYTSLYIHRTANHTKSILLYAALEKLKSLNLKLSHN